MAAARQLESFVTEAMHALSPYLEERGSLIYSTSDTLCENPVLLYGINPGQDPEITHHSNPLLKDSISNFPSQSNLIATECWLKPDGTEYEAGAAPYQRRVAKLLQHIGHQTALVTNLFFAQTRTEGLLPKGQEREKLLQACWQVHENVLNITKAKVIVALGASTARELHRRFRSIPICKHPSGHGTWGCYWERGKWDGRPIDILRIPHLSYYKVDAHADVLNWLRESVEKRLSLAI